VAVHEGDGYSFVWVAFAQSEEVAGCGGGGVGWGWGTGVVSSREMVGLGEGGRAIRCMLVLVGDPG
jgi:hypothetical protein